MEELQTELKSQGKLLDAHCKSIARLEKAQKAQTKVIGSIDSTLKRIEPHVNKEIERTNAFRIVIDYFKGKAKEGKFWLAFFAGILGFILLIIELAEKFGRK